ncbi:hypothetical protein AX769_10480 [Frondihabitans sp. PAMC 28766]|uniref:hypothetical protein n=1 Tax=Frondihabitans sp. PAMC 28766 TaxID=1795630 RepID=UPI00078CD9BD|nr:hypothetical protein [Frondihabitans sp. PAMC 28766]AMM20494.1 hypothetical protein AX769_10480 [Frondihabitans sp. PAMC 28766]
MARPTIQSDGAAGQVEFDDRVPTSIKRLECGFTSAFHAADAVKGLSLEHKVRVFDDVLGMVTDAASAAAREGHADWALHVIAAAEDRPPRWADYRGEYWTTLLDAARGAVVVTD